LRQILSDRNRRLESAGDFGGNTMRLVRIAAGLAACSLAGACGGGHAERHVAEKTAPAPAPPTPDTTPIEVLRTPAGLVLKINEPPTPTAVGSPAGATPSAANPAPTVSPVATPSAAAAPAAKTS